MSSGQNADVAVGCVLISFVAVSQQVHPLPRPQDRPDRQHVQDDGRILCPVYFSSLFVSSLSSVFRPPSIPSEPPPPPLFVDDDGEVQHNLKVIIPSTRCWHRFRFVASLHRSSPFLCPSVPLSLSPAHSSSFTMPPNLPTQTNPLIRGPSSLLVPLHDPLPETATF